MFSVYYMLYVIQGYLEIHVYLGLALLAISFIEIVAIAPWLSESEINIQ